MITSRDCVLGIDCGGTHTDSVLVRAGELVVHAKVPTNHDDLASSMAAVLDALVASTGSGGAALLGRVARVTLGTTLLVNAGVQGRLDPVGLALSAGPGLRPERFAMGTHTCVVPGGLDHRGVEVTALDTGPLERAARAWASEGVSAFACVGKFSPRNPSHEKAMAEAVRRGTGSAAGCVTLGHLLSGELDFPRRVATAFCNSACHRLHNDFLDAAERALAQRGIQAPLLLLKADGGALPLNVSRRLPVQAMLSGPAASVMGLLALEGTLSRPLGQGCVLLADMGGTTTDMGLLVDGVPVLDRGGMRVLGRRTLVRTLATVSIGVGGDSLITVDGQGTVRVGPERQGPAMAFGGARPTLLDALNVLNDADAPEADRALDFVGDEGAGDVKASRLGMETLAREHGLSVRGLCRAVWETAARTIGEAMDGLLAEVNARPVYTLRELVAYRDLSPERIFLVGGPAACVAHRLERSLARPVEAVPLAGVANALGAALTRPSRVLEVYAETGSGLLRAPSLDVEEKLPRSTGISYVEERALALLRGDMAAEGEPDAPLETVAADVFATLSDSGRGEKDMRVTCQVVPGLVGRLDPAGAAACR